MEYFSLLSSFIIFVIFTVIVNGYYFYIMNKKGRSVNFFKDDFIKIYNIISIAIFMMIFIAQILILSGIASYRSSSSIYNGLITKKYNVEVTCEHDYVCGQICEKDSSGNQTCRPKYCKEHPFDIDWYVQSNDNKIKIRRVNSSGYITPSRWGEAKINDYFAYDISLENPLKLDKDNFRIPNEIYKKYNKNLPKYPEIYDYYKFKRVVNGTSFNVLNFENELNEKIKLTTKNTKYNLNLIYVLTYEPNDDYALAIYQKWNGVNPNDVIVFYGLNEKNELKWFKINTFFNGFENQKMIADANTDIFNYLNKPMTIELMNHHYDFSINNYKIPDTKKLDYMKEIGDNRNDNITFIVGFILQFLVFIYFVVVLHFNNK